MRAGNTASVYVRKKEAGARNAHHTPKTSTTETLQVAPRSGGEETIKALLDIPLATLPVLTTSTAGEDMAVTTSMSVRENVGLQSRHAVWDETPMSLAGPPKWRSLAIGAIAGAAGVIAGQVDPDDIDGQRKRSR